MSRSTRDFLGRYIIQVKTLGGNRLTYTVNHYSIEDGCFVCFIDEKTGKTKRFHGSSCEIDEVEE